MLVIPISSHLYQVLKEVAASRRMIFVTGIPGVGKSLLIQQIALIAHEAGRKVHLLKYNLAREPFETELNISKYPEIEGVTDPAIRKAVGLWARFAVRQWHKKHPEPHHLLIGELPLIGNRLVELVEVYNDPAEALLSSEQAQFIIPVPSWEVRAVIEETRARTLADPQNELEKLDAPPNVLEAMWQEVNALAHQIGLTKANPKTPYNPYIYGGVYEALLQNRHSKTLLIDQVLRPSQSVYELEVVTAVLQADAAQVEQFMQQVEHTFTTRELRQVVGRWHASITDNPKTPDPGPELRLSLPELLPGSPQNTSLTARQKTALRRLMALPLDAGTNRVISAIDDALATLEMEEETAVTQTNTHKFDVYDGYFNVTRTEEKSGLVFLTGLLQAYRRIWQDLKQPPHTLTVVEMPMLRIALETSLRQFDLRDDAALNEDEAQLLTEQH